MSGSRAGFAMSEDLVKQFNLIKREKKYRWATFKIDAAKNEVVPADVGERTSDYSAFQKALPDDDCRYGVYDYPFTTSKGDVAEKLVFVYWAPDVAKVKAKMLYASTVETVKRSLDGVRVVLQASGPDEIEESMMAGAIAKARR